MNGDRDEDEVLLSRYTGSNAKERNMRYLRYGGHAPGHLREAFCALLECMVANDPMSLDGPLPDLAAEVFWDEPPPTVRWLLGQLWNCTDILPGMWRTEIDQWADYTTAGTYAAGVRVVHRELQAEAASTATAMIG